VEFLSDPHFIKVESTIEKECLAVIMEYFTKLEHQTKNFKQFIQ